MRMLEEEKARKLESADEDLNISDDDLTEGRHYKKLQKELKQLKQEAAQIKQQTALSATEMRLKAQYSDFDRVVSKENIEALKEKYPEVALSLAANNDIYSKAVSAYTMIKNLGIVKDDNSIDTKALVHKNMAKPKPSASISPQKGDSPLSNAYTFENGLTPELKKQLWKEMNKYAR